jgi:hypothetical protein
MARMQIGDAASNIHWRRVATRESVPARVSVGAWKRRMPASFVCAFNPFERSGFPIVNSSQCKRREQFNGLIWVYCVCRSQMF